MRTDAAVALHTPSVAGETTHMNISFANRARNTGIEATSAGRIRFDPTAPTFRRNPHDQYARLRDEAPGLRTLGTLVLTRYADVLAALRERRLRVDLIPNTVVRTARRLEAGDTAQVERFIRGSIVFTDDPEHLRLRRLINQCYTPAMLQRVKGIIEKEVRHLLDLAASAESIDAIADIAKPLPLNVLCTWMSVPDDFRSYIERQVHLIRLFLDPGMMSKSQFASTISAVAELTEFFVGHAKQCSDRREDNLISSLSAARNDGDRLSEAEVAFACVMTFVAGHETTQCLIGNSLDTLLRTPAELATLRADSRLIDAAIEESVRYETPLQMTKRVAPCALTINQHEVREAEQILLCLGAANRDPRAFAQPDSFWIGRDRVSHLGFGSGMHACLGGALARMQATACVSAMLDRFECIERVEDEQRWQTDSIILRGLVALPLRLGPQRQSARWGRST